MAIVKHHKQEHLHLKRCADVQNQDWEIKDELYCPSQINFSLSL